MKVDYIIKNKFSEQDFENSVYEWLSDGDYTPDDIIENIITEHNLLYLPVHFYKCTYDGNASASLGYTREEVYYSYNPHTKRSERRTREVTDWVKHSQSVNGKVNAVIYAGESKYNRLSSFIGGTGWTVEDLVKLNDDAGRSPKVLNTYRISLTDAWNELGVNECRRKACNEIINNLPPSNLVRNFKADLKFEINRQFSLIVPFWVFVYNYKEKSYYVSVDGNNPERISGVKPENKKRKYTVMAIRWVGWPLTICLSYLGAVTNYEHWEGGDYTELISFGIAVLIFLLLGVGIVEEIVKYIKNTSKQRRQEKLAKMRKSKNNTN